MSYDVYICRKLSSLRTLFGPRFSFIYCCLDYFSPQQLTLSPCGRFFCFMSIVLLCHFFSQVIRHFAFLSFWCITLNMAQYITESDFCQVLAPLSPLRRGLKGDRLLIHAFKEVVICFCLAQFIHQELHRVRDAHRHQNTS